MSDREPTIRKEVGLPEGLFRKLEKQARKEGRSLANLMRHIIIKATGYYDEKGGKEDE